VSRSNRDLEPVCLRVAHLTRSAQPPHRAWQRSGQTLTRRSGICGSHDFVVDRLDVTA